MKHSESITNITKALLAVQRELEGGVTKDASNPFFHSKYATLEAVLDTIKKPLNKQDILIFQTPDTITTEAGTIKTVLTTRLIHSSGEWMEGSMVLLPVKDDPQAQGSAISYARRYCLNSMLSLFQEDDDGNMATFGKKTPEEKPKDRPAPEPTVPKPLTNDQLTKLKAIKAQVGNTSEKLDDLVKEWSGGKIISRVALTGDNSEAFIKWSVETKKLKI